MLHINDDTYFKRDFQVVYTVSKCKDYYVDCERVVSYNLTDACSKLDVLLYYLKIENDFIETYRCPFYVSKLLKLKINIIVMSLLP